MMDSRRMRLSPPIAEQRVEVGDLQQDGQINALRTLGCSITKRLRLPDVSLDDSFRPDFVALCIQEAGGRDDDPALQFRRGASQHLSRLERKAKGFTVIGPQSCQARHAEDRLGFGDPSLRPQTISLTAHLPVQLPCIGEEVMSIVECPTLNCGKRLVAKRLNARVGRAEAGELFAQRLIFHGLAPEDGLELIHGLVSRRLVKILYNGPRHGEGET
jgi:hypothetical protein